MADEALACFNSLITSVPEWIKDLEGILKVSAERQKELLRLHQEADIADAPRMHARKESKSFSLESSRSRPNPTSNEHMSPSTMLRPQLPHLTDSDNLRLSQRARKTASVCSGVQSGPGKYRSRSLIVIYYDGEVQERFAKLVRAVGGCRNTVRKGKMSAKVDALSRTGSSSSEGNSSGDEMFSGKMNFRYSRSSRVVNKAFCRDDGAETFDKVDGRLEKGQALCERAAHQILRDGDCRTEVAKITELFNDALTYASQELPALRRRAEKAAKKQRRSQERARVLRYDHKYTDTSPILAEVHSIPLSEPHIVVDKLEVDDDTDDDDYAEYNLDAIHLTKFSPLARRNAPWSNRSAHAIS